MQARKKYGVKYPMYTGAMAKGIASAEICIAAGSNGMLASFGAGGLPLVPYLLLRCGTGGGV